MRPLAGIGGAMSAATQGPWKIEHQSIDPLWHIVTAQGGRIVANVHIEAGNPRDLANARLIAAAPDMLAALKKARDALKDIINASDNDSAYSASELAESFLGDLNIAEEAIVKAEGKL
jgi:Flp pilus assembly secretin CpaC